MAADHNSNQCLEKHWAYWFWKRPYIYIYACFHPVFGKALGILKDFAFASFGKRASRWFWKRLLAGGFGKDNLQVVLEKTTFRWFWKRLPSGSKPLYS